MKIFNKKKWELLDYRLKVAVACRYCILPYFDNLVVQTRLGNHKIYFALGHLTDLGKIEESWYKIGSMWVKLYKYNDRMDNDFIDALIQDMLE